MPPPTHAITPYEQVGRLASLGLSHAWQAALYLPESYVDASHCDESAGALLGDGKGIRRLLITRAPTQASSRGAPRVQFQVRDGRGDLYSASAFGPIAQWRDILAEGKTRLLQVSVREVAGQLYLTVSKDYPIDWAQRIIPVYPLASSNIIEQPKLREMIEGWLPRVAFMAADHIRHQLEQVAPIRTLLDELGAPGWDLEQLIQQAHYPSGTDYIEPARAILFRLAALGGLSEARGVSTRSRPNPIKIPSRETRINQLPFALTRDQQTAIEDIARALESPRSPARHVVSGETGVGKSCLLYVIAASTADAGGRTAILYPTGLLAREQYDKFKAFYPDVNASLVTGDTGGEEDLGAPVVIATSALLHRTFSPPDVLMIDEQQKWSRQQRDQCVGPGTHQIELSATCIPRTQALLRYGHLSMSQMRSNHASKTIYTKLWEGSEGARQLTRHVREAIADGHPVFIIYPRRERGDNKGHRHNVEAAAERWENLFPSLVRTLTSDNDANQMEAAINEIRHGTAKILICTTIVEVGVDVSNLRHLVIVEPQRYGLTALHQLRGRVARKGGEGWFHLLAPEGLPAASRARMDVILSSNDGFKIAEEDLKLRGPGDLRSKSDRQSGSDGNFLYGHAVPLEVYDEMHAFLTEFESGLD